MENIVKESYTIYSLFALNFAFSHGCFYNWLIMAIISYVISRKYNSVS
jgi:hypothetical protein